MAAGPSVDSVLQALDALYHQPDADGKHQASLWLTELQSSVCLTLFTGIRRICTVFTIKGAVAQSWRIGGISGYLSVNSPAPD